MTILCLSHVPSIIRFRTIINMYYIHLKTLLVSIIEIIATLNTILMMMMMMMIKGRTKCNVFTCVDKSQLDV